VGYSEMVVYPPPRHLSIITASAQVVLPFRGVDPATNGVSFIYFCVRGTLPLPRTSHDARQRSQRSDYTSSVTYTQDSTVGPDLKVLIVRIVVRNYLTTAGCVNDQILSNNDTTTTQKLQTG